MTDRQQSSVNERFSLGCMSGTSLDGLDVALVRLIGRKHELDAKIITHAAIAFDDALRDRLARLADDRPTRPSEISSLGRLLGNLHADLCVSVLDGLDERLARPIDFVVAHGQTIAHHPTSVAGPGLGSTWQLIDPFPIAERLGVRVCTDLRGADLAADGEGAPITPVADPILFPLDRAVVVNLGGIVNATRWRREWRGAIGREQLDITGADVGPCNLLLDPLAQALLNGARYDTDGAAAERGEIHEGIVHAIDRAVDAAMEPSQETTKPQPRSLGREQFGRSMIAQILQESETIAATPAAVLASAADAVAARIARWVGDDWRDPVIVAGGGSRNRALVARLTDRLPAARVAVSAEFGVLPEAREAAAMAVLGAMALDGLGVTVPSITGARRLTPTGRWTLPDRIHRDP